MCRNATIAEALHPWRANGTNPPAPDLYRVRIENVTKREQREYYGYGIRYHVTIRYAYKAKPRGFSYAYTSGRMCRTKADAKQWAAYFRKGLLAAGKTVNK